MSSYSLKLPFVVIGIWLSLYHLFSPLFVDKRDGSVARVGVGSPQKWANMNHPQSTSVGEINAQESESVIYSLEGKGVPRFSFLFIHDLSHHAGGLRDFAGVLAQQCLDENAPCNVYALDLAGHGQSALQSGNVGNFRVSEWVDQILNATLAIRERNKDTAVFLVGVGFGGEVAWRAAVKSEHITGVISNGLLLPNDVKFRSQTQIDVIKGIVGNIAEILLQDTKIFIPSIINFHNFYDLVSCDHSTPEPSCTWAHDPASYEADILDPLSVWHYTLPSIRSLFQSDVSAQASTKPTLVLTGAFDKVFAMEHMEQCFTMLGGAKMMRVDPAAGHTLLRGRGDRPGAQQAGKLIAGWAVAVLDGTLSNLDAHRADLRL